MIDALLSVYLVLGTSMVRAGVIKGVTEATAPLPKSSRARSGMLQVQKGPSSQGLASRSSLLRASSLRVEKLD
jgi:hypothetical protein